MNIIFAHRLSDNTELRLLEPRHAEELHALIEKNREHLKRWLSWAGGQTYEHTSMFIERVLARFAGDGSPCCGIWHEGSLVGNIDVLGISSNLTAEIGYWLDKDFQGRGLMTSACKAIVGHAFAVLGVNRVEIRAEQANKHSRAIPERLGFTEEGTLRQVINMGDYFADRVVYSMLRKEWKGETEALTFSHPLTDDAELSIFTRKLGRNGMQINIREAMKKDIPTLHTLYQQLHAGETDTTLSEITIAFQTMQEYPGCNIFVAKLNSLIVGTFVLYILPNMTRHGRPAAILENIVVDSAARGQGIGRAMLNYARELAQARGCYKLSLTSNAKRKDAHEFYRLCGMIQHGVSFRYEL